MSSKDNIGNACMRYLILNLFIRFFQNIFSKCSSLLKIY